MGVEVFVCAFTPPQETGDSNSETSQPWLSEPSPQQPSCLCPMEQVWKIFTLDIMFIICFTWQSLLLQLTHDDVMQQHCIVKPKF